MNAFKSFRGTGKTHSPRMGDSVGYDQTGEFPVLVTEKRMKVYRLFLDNNIESSQDFRWMIQAWEEAQEDDEVYLHVNSNGGSVDGMQALLQAKNNSRAVTHTVATGTVASAAAIILADSESYELSPFCNVLFHSVSFGVYGKSQDNVEYSQFIHQESKALLEYFTIGVLSISEIDDIVERKKELWLNAKDFSQRMQRKTRCRKIALDFVRERGIDPEQADPSTYVDLMVEAMALDAQAQQKPKPSRKKPAKKAPCSSECFGECNS